MEVFINDGSTYAKHQIIRSIYKFCISHRVVDKKEYLHPVRKKPLSECQNYHKQKGKVQKTYKRLSNIHKNSMHQITAKIVNREICMEELNGQGMMKNKRLSGIGNKMDRDYQARADPEQYGENVHKKNQQNHILKRDCRSVPIR